MEATSKERTEHCIKFGTDGWRALIAKEFTYDNLNLVMAAMAKYFQEKYPQGTAVLIGYDARFLADRFAIFSAGVLNSFGIPVKITNEPTPTPTMAFAAQDIKSCGTLIFTASHNPPEYMGLKYFPDYGGPATVDITNRILELIDELALKLSLSKDKKSLLFGTHKLDEKDKESLIEFLDPKIDYFQALEKLIDFELLREQNKYNKPKLIYDPIFGVGRGYVNELLIKAGFDVETLHDIRDPMFGGYMPEPKEEYLEELKERVRATGSIFGAANDGDADRFAFVDEKGDFYPANKAMAIILKYLYEHKKLKGPIARTLATTHLLEDIATKFNEKTFETPVGFKWIGEIMRKEKAVLGGEESGGMSIQGHIPEKDGIMAILLFAEVLAVTGKSISKLWAEVQDFVGKKYFYDRLDLHTDADQKAKFIRTFIDNPPKEIAGLKVIKVDKTEGAKIYLEGGTWFLARPSGTEAMCRVYFEANDKVVLEKVVADVKNR